MKLFMDKERVVNIEDLAKLEREIVDFRITAKARGAKDVQARFTQYSSPCQTIFEVRMSLCAYK